MNIIISNASSARVMRHDLGNGGLYNYLEAVGFGPECMGLHTGSDQTANLGDGQGNREQA
jgi:hypothetical protein